MSCGWPRSTSTGIAAAKRAAVAEYIDRHPELADRIREVFPAMAMREDIALADVSLATGGGPDHGDPPAG